MKKDYWKRTIADLSRYFSRKNRYLWSGFILGMSVGRNIDINENTLEDLSIQGEEGHDKVLADFCEFIAEIAEAVE